MYNTFKVLEEICIKKSYTKILMVLCRNYSIVNCDINTDILLNHLNIMWLYYWYIYCQF